MKGNSPDRHIEEELIACFPEWKELIQKIYPLNKNFREVSADFIFCKCQISSLSGSSGENTKLIKEYESTMKELEEEMLEYMDRKTI